MRTTTRRLAATLAIAVVFSPRVAAHVTSTSYSTVQISAGRARIQLLIDANRLATAAGSDANGDGRLDRAEAIRAIEAARNSIEANYYLRANGYLRPPQKEVGLDASADGTVVLRYEVVLPEPLERLEIHAALANITEPHHQHLARVILPGGEIACAFDHGVNEADVGPDQITRSAWARAVRFARLGVVHIFTGYDHLLFLTGLLLTANLGLAQLVRTVSAFTAAHSLTLVLATFGIVVLPARFVESAIALTIAYVAVENFWLTGGDRRWRLAFFFGLIHGFGFSNVLRQLALPRAALALSLFSFNAGVEIGQLVFVIALFPLLWRLSRTSRYEFARAAASVVVLLFGTYWFITRAFLAR